MSGYAMRRPASVARVLRDRRPDLRPDLRNVPSRPLRIALFSGNYNCVRDGANQALNRLVAFLERNGFTVRVYSPVVPQPAFEPAGELVTGLWAQARALLGTV